MPPIWSRGATQRSDANVQPVGDCPDQSRGLGAGCPGGLRAYRVPRPAPRAHRGGGRGATAPSRPRPPWPTRAADPAPDADRATPAAPPEIKRKIIDPAAQAAPEVIDTVEKIPTRAGCPPGYYTHHGPSPRQHAVTPRMNEPCLAAWDVHRGHVIGRCEDPIGIEPFERLVAQVMTSEPHAFADRVFWIVDNGSSHRGSLDRADDQGPAHRVSGPHPGACVMVEPVRDLLLRHPAKSGVPERLHRNRPDPRRLAAFEAGNNPIATSIGWKFTRRDLHNLLQRIEDQQPQRRRSPSGRMNTPEEFPGERH